MNFKIYQKSIVFILSLAWCYIVNAQVEPISDNWPTIELVEGLFIKMPENPEKMVQDDIFFHTVFYDDAVYVAAIKNIPTNIRSEQERKDMLSGYIDGMLEAANGELITEENILIGTITARKIKYEARGEPQIPNLRYALIFLFEDQIVNIGFWTRPELEDELAEKRERYFDSVDVNPSNTTIDTTQEAEASAYDTRFWRGLICSVLIGFIVIAGIFLIIQNVRKKKKD